MVVINNAVVPAVFLGLIVKIGLEMWRVTGAKVNWKNILINIQGGIKWMKRKSKEGKE